MLYHYLKDKGILKATDTGRTRLFTGEQSGDTLQCMIYNVEEEVLDEVFDALSDFGAKDIYHHVLDDTIIVFFTVHTGGA